jgi:hypothetical protein
LIYPQGQPTINGPDQTCTGIPVAYNTESGQINYVWTISAGGTILAGAGTSSITVRWNTAGTNSVSVNYASQNGCLSTGPVVKPVLVNQSPVPTINGTDILCPGSSGIVYFTEQGMTNYAWTISSGGLITAGNGTNAITVSWLVSGTQSITVNYTNPEGCSGNSSSSKTITILPNPAPLLNGPASSCIGTTVVYSTDPGMSFYTWTISAGGTVLSGSNTNSITVKWNATGQQSVSVSYINAFGCPVLIPSVLNVMIYPTPVPTITGSSSICPSAGIVYFTEPGMTNYSWTITPGGIITAGIGTNAITVTWQTAGTRYLTVNYTTPSGCRAINPTAITITVLPVPVPVISGPTVVSVGYTESYSTASGMIDYGWSVSSGGAIISGANTSSIVVLWHTSGTQFVNVTVINSSGCPSASPASMAVKVNPPPVVSVENITITAGQTECYGAIQTITVAGNNTYFNVLSGGSATMIAGQNILYLPGTTVQPGGYMHGYITTNGVYCGMMAPSMVTVTSVEVPALAVPLEPAFKIYPNPTSGIFYVESTGENEPGILRLDIFSMQGNRFLSQELTNERKHEFSLSDKPSGIYLVRITSGTFVKTFRVIKL